jgi:hypothetical protein
MFAWILIGFELAILYFAFWFVFVREPKQYKIKGDPWGLYEENVRRSGASNVDTYVLEYSQGKPNHSNKPIRPSRGRRAA